MNEVDLPSVDGVEFRHIPGFPGYTAGDNGTVWSKNGAGKSWRQKSSRDNGKGYLGVRLWQNNKLYSRYVHRLVLEAFVGPCPEGCEARHFPDRCRSNCRLENLSWGTAHQNAADKIAQGTSGNENFTKNPPRGERHWKAKLTEQDVIEIRRRKLAGESIKSLALRFNISITHTHFIVTRKSWASVV